MVIVTAVLALLVPVAAFAGHQFSDVPTGHPFHDQIGAVADAGITDGYSDGTFRPATGVSRQAAAAFIERGASHATSDYVASVDAAYIDDTDGDVEVLDLDVEVPGTSGGQQLVHLSATSQMYTDTTTANTCWGKVCTIYLEIRDSSDNEVGQGGFARISGDYAGSTVTVTGLVSAPAGTTQTYTVVARTHNVKDSNAVVERTSLDAVTIPMDADPS